MHARRWCQPPDSAATNIILEPGLAFGTGEHPTTRLCLRALAGMRLSGLRVMDYGTGAPEPYQTKVFEVLQHLLKWGRGTQTLNLICMQAAA